MSNEQNAYSGATIERAQVIYTQAPIPSAQDDEIDLVQLVRTLWDSRKFIASITALCTAVAIVAALMMTPIFRAEVLASPVGENEGAGKLASALGGMGLGGFAGIVGAKGDSKSEIALATLRSRAFLYSFIEDNHLLPVLFPKQWNAAKQVWKSSNPKKQPTLQQGYEAFTKGILKVSQDKKTGLVTIAIEHKDPQLAAQWANALIERLNSELKEQAIVDSERRIDYLNREIGKTRIVHLQEAMFSLVESQSKEAMLANVTDEFALKVVDPAVVPERKAKPKRSLIAASGLFLGFFLSCFLVFARNFKDELFRAEA